jgi:CRISPR-associated protein Cmr3
MSCLIGLQLTPLDVLFFRDGRPFGAASHGYSGLPLPQTLAGALWTALLERHGCPFDQLGELARHLGSPAAALRELDGGRLRWIADLQLRGPWLARPAGSPRSLDVLVAMPAILQRPKRAAGSGRGSLLRLSPLPVDSLPGWRHSHGAAEHRLRPLWMHSPEPAEMAAGYLNSAGLRRFLAGDDVPADGVVPASDLYDFDRRTGIGIDPGRLAAQESLIYGARFLALRPDVVLYAEVELPDGVSDHALDAITTLPFGGEGRRVQVEVLRDDRRFRWPECTATPPGKPLLLLTTPGLFASGWKPAACGNHGMLAAAAVPGSAAVSGWDLARGGPKPTRFAAQSGSVYFLDKPLPSWPRSLSDQPADQAQGWGCYLQGIWND